jgi:hypothetical protein
MPESFLLRERWNAGPIRSTGARKLLREYNSIAPGDAGVLIRMPRSN